MHVAVFYFNIFFNFNISYLTIDLLFLAFLDPRHITLTLEM